MSVEREVSEILANLEGRRPGSWGHQAAIVAEGVRGSGILDQIDQAGERLQTSLAGLAAVMGISAGAIAAEISTSNQFLEMVANSLRDPGATAANERFRAGLTALQNGWRPEAIEEFEESIKLFRLHAPTHAALGHALAAEGRLREAAASYALAQRYSMPDNPGMAAGCALLGSAALEGAGDISGAGELLAKATESLPDVAEVSLAFSRVSGDAMGLRKAFIIAPDLVVVAAAAGIPHVDDVATELAAAADGPVALARRVLHAFDGLRAYFPRIVFEPELPRLGHSSPIDELAESNRILSASAKLLEGLTAQGFGIQLIAEEPVNPSQSEIELADTISERAEADARLPILRRGFASIEDVWTSLRKAEVFHLRFAADDCLPGERIPGLAELLQEHHTMGLVVRSVEAESDPHWALQQFQASLAKLRDRLAGMGVEDPDEEYATYRAGYFANLGSKRDEAEESLERLVARRGELDEREVQLQNRIDEEHTAWLKVVSDSRARWDQLIRDVESVVALRPTRLFPWGGEVSRSS